MSSPATASSHITHTTTNRAPCRFTTVSTDLLKPAPSKPAGFKSASGSGRQEGGLDRQAGGHGLVSPSSLTDHHNPPFTVNLWPETGGVAWSIRCSGSWQVACLGFSPPTLPYTAPLHHQWKTRAFSASPPPQQTDRAATAAVSSTQCLHFTLELEGHPQHNQHTQCSSECSQLLLTSSYECHWTQRLSRTKML